jgi:hypothetical protein
MTNGAAQWRLPAGADGVRTREGWAPVKGFLRGALLAVAFVAARLCGPGSLRASGRRALPCL